MRATGLVFGVIVLASWGLLASPAAAQSELRTGTFAVGAGVGLQGDTADGTVFGAALSGDYFFSHNFSLGPLLQLGFGDDLTQVGVSLQFKLSADIPEIPNLVPHVQAGIGFIYADLDLGPFGDVDDTSFLIPVGVGAAYYLTPKLALDSTVLLNFTDLDDVRDENLFVTWIIGLRYHF
jgi:hypothetical protein